MKKLGIFDKFIFILNSLAALALLLSYLLPLIPPKSFPLLSVLSLGVPVLIILNFLFFIYWVLRLKRQFLISLIILLAGYKYVNRFIEIGGDKGSSEKADFSIMSYNVRMFNQYEWTSRKNIPQKITDFVKEKNPDVLCMQEYYVGTTDFSRLYPYKYIKVKEKNSEFGTAIFSKFPILKKHSLNFPQDGNNNAIYADILINNKDTIRVFNVHFQSLNINAGIDDIQKEDSRKLLGRIGYGFSLQQDQVEMLLPVVQNTPYRKMIAGDFNNTAFSYLYNLLKTEADLNDAFMQQGSGFGKSFSLNYFPLRIDFMLLSEELKTTEFHRFKIDYSDHFPILSKIKL